MNNRTQHVIETVTTRTSEKFGEDLAVLLRELPALWLILEKHRVPMLQYLLEMTIIEAQSLYDLEESRLAPNGRTSRSRDHS